MRLTAIILAAFVGAIPMYGQAAPPQTQDKTTDELFNQALNVQKIKEKIVNLETSINDLIKYKGDTSDDIHMKLDTHIQKEYGVTLQTLVITTVDMKLSNGKITAITFKEKNANLETNVDITKRIENNSFQTGNFDDLEISEWFDSDFKQDVMREKVKLSELKDLSSQRKLLERYRDFLLRLDFRLQSYRLRELKRADYKLNRILAD